MAITMLELATPKDANILQSSAIEAFSDDFNKYGYFPPNIESIDWFRTEIQKGKFYKIIHVGEFAGGLCVDCGSENSIEIKCIYIEPKLQDKHIGSKVMNLIENKYNYIAHWSLLTPCKAYRNHHFYEKLGYVKAGEFQPDPNDDFKVFEYTKECHINKCT